MSDAEELKRLRQAVRDLEDVMRRHESGEVTAHYVVGWLESTLKRLSGGLS